MSAADLEIIQAVAGDHDVLHDIARQTFPLACPPGTSEENIERFIGERLSPSAFAGYLNDPRHTLFLAKAGGGVVGYAMVISPPVDPDIAQALKRTDSLELSKIYVLESAHGTGVAANLLHHSIQRAVFEGCGSVWLGVNQENDRALRFYTKNGFEIVGERGFVVGDRVEQDYVLEKLL